MTNAAIESPNFAPDFHHVSVHTPATKPIPQRRACRSLGTASSPAKLGWAKPLACFPPMIPIAVNPSR